MDKGIKVTVNSDDPAYFGGHLNENFLQIRKALDLTKEDIVELVKNSFQYSFASEEQKSGYLKRVDAFVADFQD